MNELDQNGGDDSCDERSDSESKAISTPSDDEGDDNAWQGTVTNRVS